MRRLLIAFGVLVGLYVLVVGALYAFQRSFIYPAPVSHPWPRAAGFETVAYTTSDGLILRALYRPAEPGKPTILFFHGNGDSLRGSLVSTEAYAAKGYGLLLHEYRGYGGNPGAPDEAGLYADGRAARAWLESQGVPGARQILMGFSLGTGVAAHLALEQSPAALVLISPYTSVPEAASWRFASLFPAQLLVKDKFDTQAKIARIAAPVLIMHDRDDASIPVEQGERLALLNRRARLLLFSGYGHQLGFSAEAQGTGLAWILEAVR